MREVARNTRDLLYTLKGVKKIKILGISIISLIWIFSLIISATLGALLYFTIAYKYSMSDEMTDTVEVIEKLFHVQLGTFKGELYDESTVYLVEFSNNEVNEISIPGIHNYRPGTQIEMLYRKSSLTGTIEVIDFNAELNSDTTILNSDFEHPFWEDLKSIKAEKLN